MQTAYYSNKTIVLKIFLSFERQEIAKIIKKEAKIVREFYFASKDEVLGIGRRVGDIWIQQLAE